MKGNNAPVTITDIAKKAGVSAATVSRVLSNSNYPVSKAARDRVNHWASKLKYEPNLYGKMLKSGNTRDIGIIFPSFSNPFFSSLMLSIEKHCRKNNLVPVFCNSANDPELEALHINRLRQGRVMGILLSSVSVDSSVIQTAINQGVKIILLDQQFDDLYCDCVSYDFFQAGKIAVDHLVSKGHKNIAFLSPPLFRYSRKSLWSGIKTQLEHHGLPCNDSCLMTVEHSVLEMNNRSLWPAQKRLFSKLLSQNKDCTAVIALNDLMAIEFMRFLRETGHSIPDDISVMGFDDIDLCDCQSPPLTSISQNTDDIGCMVVDAIASQVNSSQNSKVHTTRKLVLSPLLVERGSVKQL